MKTNHRLYPMNSAAWLLIFLLTAAQAFSQPATVAYPIGVGVSTCTGSLHQNMEFNFNPTTNTLSNSVTCIPSLASPGYNSSLASVAFNPADGLLYYIRYTGSNSYVYRWAPNTCPSSLAVTRVFNNQFVGGVAFDASGVGWQINFTGSSAPYGLTLQKVDFVTGTIGAQATITLPAGVQIGTQNGDLIYSPSGILYFAFDNKLLTVNPNNYLLGPLNATYIDTLELGSGNKLVGLAYSDGKLLASIRGSSSCFYREINNMTGDTSVIKYTGSYSAKDLTSVISGVGAAKSLSSAIPTGTTGVYDLKYDVTVTNFGNVPDSNVQVTDNLATVFGASNISNVSLSWVGTAPSGMSLNPSYNGNSNTNLLTTATNVLPNYPVANNSFTIRISVRVAGIVPGTVYNNNAVATATGYRSVALRDVSTNGTDPDLNTNDKPDDAGESQPTPFIVNVAAETPPCSALNNILYIQNFGSGTGFANSFSGGGSTDYTFSSSAPLATETYALSNNANNGDPSRWINLTDHTGNSNGRMLLVNADVQPSVIYRDEVNVQCTGLKYSFFGYMAFIGNGTNYQSFCNAFGGFKYPQLGFTVRNAADNSIITSTTTGLITSNSWSQFGLKFVMPAGVTKVILEIYNTGQGGCGNDLALDDIQFGMCDPTPTVSASSITGGCIGGPTSLGATLSDTTGMGSNLVYQWQTSTDGTNWTNRAGATSTLLSINPTTAADAIYYRLIVATPGNLNNTTCRYVSNSLLLTAKTSSTAALSATTNKLSFCPGETVTLSAVGGSLGTNAVWRWYSGSCGGTPIGTGQTLTFTPSTGGTYYVRAEGDCNTTICRSVTLTVNCAILDAEIVKLNGNRYGNNVGLKWVITSDRVIDYFEIERSSDGINFTKVGQQPGIGGPCNQTPFAYTDNIASFNGDEIYYRIKLIVNGQVSKISSIVVIHANNNHVVTIAPNPASQSFSISMYNNTASVVEVSIIDVDGRVVMKHEQQVTAGQNNFSVSNIGRLSQGLYHVQIKSGNEFIRKKLIIKH
jgi:uncharacterized repeat protein (TIGR01451 family)